MSKSLNRIPPRLPPLCLGFSLPPTLHSRWKWKLIHVGNLEVYTFLRQRPAAINYNERESVLIFPSYSIFFASTADRAQTETFDFGYQARLLLGRASHTSGLSQFKGLVSSWTVLPSASPKFVYRNCASLSNHIRNLFSKSFPAQVFNPVPIWKELLALNKRVGRRKKNRLQLPPANMALADSNHTQIFKYTWKSPSSLDKQRKV